MEAEVVIWYAWRRDSASIWDTNSGAASRNGRVILFRGCCADDKGSKADLGKRAHLDEVRPLRGSLTS